MNSIAARGHEHLEILDKNMGQFCRVFSDGSNRGDVTGAGRVLMSTLVDNDFEQSWKNHHRLLHPTQEPGHRDRERGMCSVERPADTRWGAQRNQAHPGKADLEFPAPRRRPRTTKQTKIKQIKFFLFA